MLSPSMVGPRTQMSSKLGFGYANTNMLQQHLVPLRCYPLSQPPFFAFPNIPEAVYQQYRVHPRVLVKHLVRHPTLHITVNNTMRYMNAFWPELICLRILLADQRVYRSLPRLCKKPLLANMANHYNHSICIPMLTRCMCKLSDVSSNSS